MTTPQQCSYTGHPATNSATHSAASLAQNARPVVPPRRRRSRSRLATPAAAAAAAAATAAPASLPPVAHAQHLELKQQRLVLVVLQLALGAKSGHGGLQAGGREIADLGRDERAPPGARPHAHQG